jgi:SAM-dependent methyltransferase
MSRTNWDQYYLKPCKAAKYTRKITAGHLLKNIRDFANTQNGLEVIELGGANSCFFDALRENIAFGNYTIVDNNAVGLELFQRTHPGADKVSLLNQDILHLQVGRQADVVFSVGLIEHFSKEDTARAIRTHLDLLKPQGVAIISFPTPTWLYRFIRHIAELTGSWSFPDERPLCVEEVSLALGEECIILRAEILWCIGLTQAMLAIRKK